MNWDFEQLRGLDFNNLGSWPPLARLLAYVVVVLLVAGLGYYFFVADKLVELERVEGEESQLRQTFETKQRKAANLDAYREQMRRMQETFKTLLQQLPRSSEVPGLIDEISFAARGAGLELEAFENQPDRAADFYVEKPIKLVVSGNYHQLADFVSRVSNLPRIVTLHDFNITTRGSGTRGGQQTQENFSEENLTMEILAKTYRYDSGEGN